MIRNLVGGNLIIKIATPTLKDVQWLVDRPRGEGSATTR